MADTLQRKARITGVFYLGLALAGAAGFLTVRPMLFAAGDPQATLIHLAEHQSLARLGVALELFVVLAQALAAAGFYRLFRAKAPVAAAGIAAFGLVNAVVVLGSAALLATAAEVAGKPFGDAAATVQLLYLISGHLWAAGDIFFGLWLIPMGLAVLTTGWMPRLLGWVLIAGGIGYVVSAFVPGDLLVLPATIGEVWMVGYLLIRGVRQPASGGAPAGQPGASDRDGR
ncbi:hypothetical protein BJ973_004978 [Actinoplanes tereljensis]|uniref:DUF4386 domain-containing protein n=1 Tax=Paractinoplanes tereljensis TaxID=571912 RepID=A0A919TV31_9ACTN|nr:DUF4386 domain-containing protein [Actinoplanes tereljensis]GIF21577.1 hypothetical protein Ate02nite_43070 [Actinoplanes tereljensis]